MKAHLVDHLSYLRICSCNLALPYPIIITNICCIAVIITSIGCLHKQLLLDSLGLCLLLLLCCNSRCYALVSSWYCYPLLLIAQL